MSFLRLLLNVLWILTGGLWMAAAWLLASLIMAISIVGLPWARAGLTIAVYTLLPFGNRVISRAEYTGYEDIGTGPLGFVGNVLWLVLAGWWLALGHLSPPPPWRSPSSAFPSPGRISSWRASRCGRSARSSCRCRISEAVAPIGR